MRTKIKTNIKLQKTSRINRTNGTNEINKAKFKKYMYIFINVISIFTIIFLNYSDILAASDPTLVNKLNTVFKKIQGYLVKLATPVAGVAIAMGVMMRKLSFGDEEKMAKGKKTIMNAIIGYSIIISINLIIKFIDALLG